MRTTQESIIQCDLHEKCVVRRWFCSWQFWVAIFIPVFSTTVGTIYAYGRLNERVDINQEKVIRLENLQRETHDLVKEIHGIIKAKGIVSQ